MLGHLIVNVVQDENTRYIDIGPVNKAMNLLCCWFEDPDSEAFRRSVLRLFFALMLSASRKFLFWTDLT